MISNSEDKFDNIKLNPINEGNFIDVEFNEEIPNEQKEEIDVVKIDSNSILNTKSFLLDDLNVKLEKEMQNKFIENVKNLKGKKKTKNFKNKKLDLLMDEVIDEEFEVIKILKKKKPKKNLEEILKKISEENSKVLKKVKFKSIKNYFNDHSLKM